MFSSYKKKKLETINDIEQYLPIEWNSNTHSLETRQLAQLFTHTAGLCSHPHMLPPIQTVRVCVCVCVCVCAVTYCSEGR